MCGFVAEILNRVGYKTEVGVKVQGDCVTHEIDVISRLNLHPITCLSALTKAEKALLTDKGIVLTVQLYENKNALNEIEMDQRKVNRVIKEAKAICSYHSNNS